MKYYIITIFLHNNQTLIFIHLDNSSVVQFVQKGEPDNLTKVKSLGELIISIREVFQNDVVNVDEIKALLKSYEVERKDWNNLVLNEEKK